MVRPNWKNQPISWCKFCLFILCIPTANIFEELATCNTILAHWYIIDCLDTYPLIETWAYSNLGLFMTTALYRRTQCYKLKVALSIKHKDTLVPQLIFIAQGKQVWKWQFALIASDRWSRFMASALIIVFLVRSVPQYFNSKEIVNRCLGLVCLTLTITILHLQPYPVP